MLKPFKTHGPLLAPIICAAATTFAPHASAALVIDLLEVGADVVATGSGTANITGLTVASSTPASAINPSTGFLTVGPTSNRGQILDIVTGPSSFGSGGNDFSDTGGRIGDFFGVGGSSDNLYLPLNYVSGSALSGSNTWGGLTFAAMGITPGSYTWTWDYSGGTDSITVNAGPQVVPTPAPLALVLSVLAGFIGHRLLARSRA